MWWEAHGKERPARPAGGPSAPPLWRHVVAGASAGWATAIITCPLDVVKARLQTQHLIPAGAAEPRLRGATMASLRAIWAAEGIAGLYRGLTPTLFGYIPALGLYFPAYQYLKGRIAAHRGTSPDSDPIVHLAAAMAAGAFGNVLVNPVWLVRTRLMTQHMLLPPPSTFPLAQPPSAAATAAESQIYKGPVDAFRSIYRNEGLRGFYKGASASVVGVLHIAIQFPLYEWLKRRLHSAFPSDHAYPLQIVAASITSKVIASSATYPHEVVRSRLQIQRHGAQRYSGPIDAIRKIWLEEGIAGFYGGLRTNILRVIPASATTFVTFELILRHL